MTLLVHELPGAGQSVLERLRETLRTSSDERISGLLARVPSPAGQEPFRLVATGEYNAGKSSLLKALTGAEIRIHSDVTTTEVHEYAWDRVLLIDTPGVGAGAALHDERAEEALRAADLVMFVITVDLFDDQTADHLRHVAFDLGKAEQMVIVVNKAATMAAAAGLREAEVREVLGPGWTGPMVECDARSSLEAASASTSERSTFLSERGNRAGLERALNRLVGNRAVNGRLRRPFDAALAVVDDAQPYLVPEPEEAAMAALLERRRQVVAESRLRLDARLQQAFSTTRDQIIAAGDALVAAAGADAVSDAAVDEFERAARARAESLGDLVRRAFEREIDELAAEERGLLGGPEAQTLADAALLDVDFETSAGEPVEAGSSTPRSSFARLVQQFATDRGRDWLDGAIRQGNRPGSPLHDLVYRAGKWAGHKFKPWEAVKWAKRLQAALGAAVVLVDFYVQLRAMQREESELQQHQLDLRRQVREAADDLIEQARADVAPAVTQFYEVVGQSVRELEDSLDRIAGERSRLESDLEQIRREAVEALEILARHAAGDAAS